MRCLCVCRNVLTRVEYDPTEKGVGLCNISSYTPSKIKPVAVVEVVVVVVVVVVVAVVAVVVVVVVVVAVVAHSRMC